MDHRKDSGPMGPESDEGSAANAEALEKRKTDLSNWKLRILFANVENLEKILKKPKEQLTSADKRALRQMHSLDLKMRNINSLSALKTFCHNKDNNLKWPEAEDSTPFSIEY